MLHNITSKIYSIQWTNSYYLFICCSNLYSSLVDSNSPCIHCPHFENISDARWFNCGSWGSAASKEEVEVERARVASGSDMLSCPVRKGTSRAHMVNSGHMIQAFTILYFLLCMTKEGQGRVIGRPSVPDSPNLDYAKPFLKAIPRLLYTSA